jgi:hypothetical protein
MYIVMYNSTHRGGFLCTTVHRKWRVVMYILTYNSTQRVDGSYVHCNVQQYTDSFVGLLIQLIFCSNFYMQPFVIVITLMFSKRQVIYGSVKQS